MPASAMRADRVNEFCEPGADVAEVDALVDPIDDEVEYLVEPSHAIGQGGDAPIKGSPRPLSPRIHPAWINH